jgi:hypothetical protein
VSWEGQGSATSVTLRPGEGVVQTLTDESARLATSAPGKSVQAVFAWRSGLEDPVAVLGWTDDDGFIHERPIGLDGSAPDWHLGPQ